MKMEIVGNVKNYDWGKLGGESNNWVVQLLSLNSESFAPDSATPYAELWFGDHPSGTAVIKETGECLRSFLSKDREHFIGGRDQLSFLFKVLSIRKALSIQVHPNKEEAEELHKERPDVYKDPNHKPELAIALTPFVGLCGFRPWTEIWELCTEFTPLKKLLGDTRIDRLGKDQEGLKECFKTLMESDEKAIAECIDDILEKHGKDLQKRELLDIFNTIFKDFRYDVGLLCLFFLNVVHLQPGEAIYLPANVPHAYLCGDCVECMACSDNVIRAGLTPKYKDVATLTRLLNYEGAPAERQLFKPSRVDQYLELFAPDVEDFSVARLNIPKGSAVYKMKASDFGSVILVIRGRMRLKAGNHSEVALRRGSTLFIPGYCDFIEFQAVENETEDFLAFIAMSNDF